jgi:hypothetical protein
MRNVLAIIIAPLMPAILMIGLPVLFSLSWPFNETDYIYVIVVSIVFGYLGFAIFGLPLMLWLKRANKLNLVYLSLGGALTGAIVSTLFFILLGLLLNSNASLKPGGFIWGAALGFSVAITYGAISGITIRSKATPQSGAL